MMGKTLAALSKHASALKSYQQAFQTDPTDMIVVRGLADVCFALQDWAGALTNYQKVLASLGEDETELRTEIFHRLGRDQARTVAESPSDHELRKGA